MPDDVVTGLDPTKAVLSESALNKKYLCDYVVNVATGCRHGCRFCYVPSSPQIRTRAEMLKDEADVDNPQKEWGSYLLHRPEETADKLAGKLENKRTWKDTSGGRGIVALSFSTDCYQDAHSATVTRGCIEALTTHDRPDGKPIHVRILTRNPTLALQDLDAYLEAEDRITIGSSIPSLNDDHVNAIEPQAPLPTHRLRSLQEFADAGVNTYVSMSPTYPTQDKDDLRTQMQRFAELDPDVIFHEPINSRGGNFRMTVEAAREAGEEELARELDRISSREAWAEYAVQQLRWVQELGEELDLPVHLWPDKELTKVTRGGTQQWVEAWRSRESPEDFAGRPDPAKEMPELPEGDEVGQSALDEFGG